MAYGAADCSGRAAQRFTCNVNPRGKFYTTWSLHAYAGCTRYQSPIRFLLSLLSVFSTVTSDESSKPISLPVKHAALSVTGGKLFCSTICFSTLVLPMPVSQTPIKRPSHEKEGTNHTTFVCDLRRTHMQQYIMQFSDVLR